MVALKRPSSCPTVAGCPRKQERRGGIETQAGIPLERAFRVKQERRGGIETRHLGQHHRQALPEAGTPWWH